MTATILGSDPAATLGRPDVCAPERALALLSGMAVSLGHDFDLDSLLAELAMGVRRTLDAERVSVLLLDSGEDGNERLTPAVAVARRHDDHLWQRFRRMPPIPFAEVPGARQAVAEGKVLVIPDARVSPLVPRAWQQTFELGSLAIAPLMVADVPAGVLSVEYADPSGSQTPAQLALLEGMAALAGVALRHGRQRGHVQRVEAAATLVRELAAVRTPRAVAELSLAALLETARVSHGLLGLLRPGEVEVVAVRGPHLLEPGRYGWEELPTGLVDTCREAWLVDPRVPVAVELQGRSLLVLPCAGRQGPSAVAVLPVAVTSLPYDVAVDLQLTADTTATALGSLRLAEKAAWHRRAVALLAGAPETVEGPVGVTGLVEAVCSLLAEAGLESPRVVVDRALARSTGLPPAPAEVTRQLRRRRHAGSSQTAVRAGEESLLPLRSGDQVVGALLWTSPRHRVLRGRPALAAALLGDLLGRVLAHQRLGTLQRQEEVTATHGEVAARTYREATRILDQLTCQLHSGATPEPAASVRELGVQLRGLLRDAAEVLAPTAVPQADLRAALTSLAAQTFARGGPETVVRQVGRGPSPDQAVQVALLRATQRILSLLRESRAAAATVHLDCGEHEVVVTVHADQLLAATDSLDGTGLAAALRDTSAWLRPVGGLLERERIGPVHRIVLRAPVVPHPAPSAPPG